MATVGEVNKIEELVIEWKIKNFFSLSREVDISYYSPDFSFADAIWYLGIYPNGESKSSVGYISLYLHRSSSGPAINLDYYLGLKDIDKEMYEEIHYNYTFEEPEGYGSIKFLRRSQLMKERRYLVPSSILTVVCRLQNPKPTTTGTAKCEYCKVNLEAHEDLASHHQKCMDKPIKCPECGDVIALKNWYIHKCQSAEVEAHNKVLSDLKEMMLSGDHSDTIIMVKGEEFRLHKNILAVRSPYFHAMFKNDMKEKNTGVVSIDDCEPDIFHSFINFLYTGKIDKLSFENVCGLYETANKYQEELLKKACLHFMLNTVSIDNFCDLIVLALMHDDKKLLQDTTKFFASKIKEIIRSVKWQTFLLENPIQANELLIKALDYSDDK